jgi:cytochrome c oxidase assembly factor CtaG
MKFTFDPGFFVLLALAASLYARAVRALARRGRRVSPWQQAAWYGGLALMALAIMGPASGYVERLLVAHMAEHLLIAELAAPLLLVGLRTPVLQHYLPAPLMRPLARSRLLQRLRIVGRPPVAIAIFLVVLYVWHFPFAFEGALRNEWLHGLQHQSFIVISMLVWWPALEPNRARLPGQLWKIAHIFAARMVSIFLGMALIVSRTPWYHGYYGGRAREYGLSPLADQQLAGGMMMSLDVVIAIFALCLFFWLAAADAERLERAQLEKAERPVPS